jgi:hypothetical protein
MPYENYAPKAWHSSHGKEPRAIPLRAVVGAGQAGPRAAGLVGLAVLKDVRQLVGDQVGRSTEVIGRARRGPFWLGAGDGVLADAFLALGQGNVVLIRPASA